MSDTEVTADGFRFDFSDAEHAFKFDASHDAPMKAVDIIVEFAAAYVFIEIKDYDDSDYFNVKLDGTEGEKKERRDHYRWLKGYLKYKYRDSYLYRHAEGKIDKPIYYVCLLTLDNPLNNHLAKELRKELPLGFAGGKWSMEIAASCQIVNEERWKKAFPKWHIERV